MLLLRRHAIERKLTDAHRQLVLARQELAVVNEQMLVVDDLADDARLRAVVADTPTATKEHDEASRQAAVMHQTRDALARHIADLERRQAELLERLAVGPG